MNIIRVDHGKTKRGPADYFTGVVWIDEVSPTVSASGVQVALVTFEPGARTAWHTHPHGQLLRIMSGVGRVQKEGETVVAVQPGDVVWFEPGERHWHGASPMQQMVHLAVQRADAAGKTATWQEHVSSATEAGP
jgi:quercetin dioxygenase-like cupin family protein